jgi:KaiC/GvpD/RAD55 family RecA-like ATPase
MPRMSSAEREKYRFAEDNPNPRFKPSVQAVMNKLRQLKVFEDPHSAALIIDDLIYRHLLCKQGQPNQLYYLLMQVYSYWGRSLNLQENQKREHTQNPATRDAVQEILSLGDLYSKEDPPQEVEKPVLDLEDKELKKRARSAIEEHEYAPYMTKGINVPRCTCGREFEFREQWSNHVRSLIWKELKEHV